MKKYKKIFVCIFMICLLITQSLAYRYTTAKAIVTEAIVLTGAGLLSAAAFTYGFIVKSHSVVEQWADDWQKELKENAQENFNRMEKTGYVAGELLEEAGEYIKGKIIGDRAVIEHEKLADGIVVHSDAPQININNFNYDREVENGQTIDITMLQLRIPASKIATGAYLVAAGMFVEDAELAERLKYDGCVITTSPLSNYVNDWCGFETFQWASDWSSHYEGTQYCTKFENGSAYYVYTYSRDASGLTFEQVQDIYNQAIAGGVVKVEKAFEQVASDEYVDKALSDDYALAPSNAYEVSLTDEKVASISQTVAGTQDDVKDIAWSDAMADVGAVAVAGDVALDCATAQDIAYADVIAGTQVKAESDPSKWQFPLTAFFPFCIPFDIYNMLTAFKAKPEAPYYTFKTTVRGVDYGFTIDLSPFDSVAAVLRKLELVAFSIGLAFATNKLIKH